jgi:uncharacterized membrane protein YbhN (UPF0104 family)
MSFPESGEVLLGRLGGVAPIPLALALAFHVAKLCARARGWHNIVGAAYPKDRLRFRHALGAFLAGVGVDAVVPARAGEVVRVRLVRTRLASSSFPGLASTVLAESAFDVFLAVLVIGVGIVVGFGAGAHGSGFVFGPVAHHPLALALTASGVVLVVGLLGLRFRARVRSFLLEARRGLAVFGRPRQYLRSVASWQAVGWTLRVASVYWFLAAFHAPATPAVALMVVAVQVVATAVPLMPGGAGAQQAILVVALSGTAAATVLGFGIGMQATAMLADLVLGAASLVFLTGSLRRRPCALRGAEAVTAPVAG